MNKPGPPRKPTRLKVLEGNPGKQRIAPEVQPGTGNVKCPSWLRGVARREWKRHAPNLHRLGLLTNSDVNAFAIYCQAFSDYITTVEEMRDQSIITEMGKLRVHNPWMTAQKQLIATIVTVGARFGLTPSDRAGLATPESEVNPMDEFLRRHNPT